MSDLVRTTFSADGLPASQETAAPVDPEGVDGYGLAGSGKTDVELVDYFEVASTASFVVGNGFQRVALQFPDELLRYSSFVLTHLESHIAGLLKPKESMVRLFVLADTSYGSCCVDEVAASHLDPDTIVHYGRSCLSPTKRYPVHYVFGRAAIDVDDCVAKLEELFLTIGDDAEADTSPVVVLFDVIYNHAMENLRIKTQQRVQSIRSKSSKESRPIIFSELNVDERKNASSTPSSASDHPHGAHNSSQSCSKENGGCRTSDGGVACEEGQCGTASVSTTSEDSSSTSATTSSASCSSSSRPPVTEQPEAKSFLGRNIRVPRSIKDFDIRKSTIFYVGRDGKTLTTLMMTLNKNKVFAYDPVSKSVVEHTSKTNRAVMRRYVMVEKAKDANVIGILVGTLGVDSYFTAIEAIKRLIKAVGKKYYTFVVGKLNVAKLANFPEVDIFVLVACSENTLIDSKDFYKPVITPYELFIALARDQNWTGNIETEFIKLLPALKASAEDREGWVPDEDEEPRFSLLTGRLQSLSVASPPSSGNNTNESASGGEMVRVSGNRELIKFESAAADYLASRSFRGLDTSLDGTEDFKVKEGRSGIARGYSHEPGKAS